MVNSKLHKPVFGNWVYAFSFQDLDVSVEYKGKCLPISGEAKRLRMTEILVFYFTAGLVFQWLYELAKEAV